MKKLFRVLLAVVLVSVAAFAHYNHNGFNTVHNDHHRYEFDDDYITIYSEDYDYDYIKINSDLDLIVSGEIVKTHYHERKLLAKYYKLLRKIHKMGKEVGYEGARLGMRGAKVGLKAVVKLPMAIFGHADEYQRAIEREADKIEREAEILEERAEEIEAMADKINKYEHDLKHNIDELDDLDWY